MKNRIVVLAILSAAALCLMGAARPDFGAFLGAASPTVFRPDTGTGWSTPNLPYLNESLATTLNPATATAPSLATDGFELKSSAPYDLHVEVLTSPTSAADDAGTCVTANSADKDANAGFSDNRVPTMWLRAYIYNPANFKWSRAPLLDVQTTGNVTNWVKTGITPPSNISRVAYAFDTTASTCPLKIYIISR